MTNDKHQPIKEEHGAGAPEEYKPKFYKRAAGPATREEIAEVEAEIDEFTKGTFYEKNYITSFFMAPPPIELTPEYLKILTGEQLTDAEIITAFYHLISENIQAEIVKGSAVPEDLLNRLRRIVKEDRTMIMEETSLLPLNYKRLLLESGYEDKGTPRDIYNSHIALNQSLFRLFDAEAALLDRYGDKINLWLADFGELFPYIEKELKKDIYNGEPFGLLTNSFIEPSLDDDGHIIKEHSRYYILMQEANKARAESAGLERVKVIKPEKIDFPIDKVNSVIFSLTPEQAGSGVMSIKAENSSKTKQPINIFYSIDFEEIGNDVSISKELTIYDKYVMIAIAALYNAGNSIITYTQIYNTMQYTGRPGTEDIKKIAESVNKMTRARITVNNEQEAEVYNYPKFIYDGSLLPFERQTAILNGKIADAAIHFFREPPLIKFARDRKQLTAFNIKTLKDPLNKTDRTLKIKDYLINRIAKARNGSGQKKILYATICKHAGITDKKAVQRLPATVKKLLDFYQSPECGFIDGYTTAPDGVTVKIQSANKR